MSYLLAELEDHTRQVMKMAYDEGVRDGMKMSKRGSRKTIGYTSNGYDGHEDDDDEEDEPKSFAKGQKVNRKQIEKFAAGKDHCFVLYHWHPCGPCKQLRKKLGVDGDNAAAKLLESGKVPNFLMVEADHVGDDLKITGFPTIEEYRGGELVDEQSAQRSTQERAMKKIISTLFQ